MSTENPYLSVITDVRLSLGIVIEEEGSLACYLREAAEAAEGESWSSMEAMESSLGDAIEAIAAARQRLADMGGRLSNLLASRGLDSPHPGTHEEESE